MSKLFTVTSDTKSIARMTEAIFKTGEWLDHSMKVLGVSVAIHAIEHGNIGPANDVILRLSKQVVDESGKVKGQNSSAIRLDWFTRMLLTVGPFVKSGNELKFDRAKCTLLQMDINEKTKAVWIANAVQRNWTAEKKESIFEGYSAVEKAMNMIASMERDLKNTDKAPVIRDADPAFFTAMKEVFTRFEVTAKPKKGAAALVPAH